MERSFEGKSNRATENEINRTTEDDDSIDAMSRAGAVGLHRLQQGVLAAGRHHAEEEQTEMKNEKCKFTVKVIFQVQYVTRISF